MKMCKTGKDCTREFKNRKILAKLAQKVQESFSMQKSREILAESPKTQ